MGYRGGGHPHIGRLYWDERTGSEVPRQSLSKEVGSLMEALGKNHPGEVAGSLRIWICPGESKMEIGIRV